MSLSNYISIANALVLLMKPLVEIVIHDLESDSICHISGNLSKRKIGDPSLLGEDLDADIDKIVYAKLNFDGRLIKSISVPLSQKWLMCINCDISVFNQMQLLSQHFLHQPEEEIPTSLFKNDWQEKLHRAIHFFVNEQHWSFETLKGSQKKELIKYLFEIRAFDEKNAADYVANVLNMGRATIFKHLKEWRIS